MYCIQFDGIYMHVYVLKLGEGQTLQLKTTERKSIEISSTYF